jgi:hypothetical protein
MHSYVRPSWRDRRLAGDRPIPSRAPRGSVHRTLANQWVLRLVVGEIYVAAKAIREWVHSWRCCSGFRRQEDALTSPRWLQPGSLAVLSSPQFVTVFPERRVRVVFAPVALLTLVARRRHRREGDMQDLLLSQGLVQLVSAGWRTLLSSRESVPLGATADERAHTSTEPGFCNGRSSRVHPFEGESTVARWRGRR